MAYISVHVDEDEVLDEMSIEEIQKYLALRMKSDGQADDITRLVESYRLGKPLDDEIRSIADKYLGRAI